MGKKIVLVGGYPPPYGGITVHIKRLKALLEKEGHIVTVVDLLEKKNEPAEPEPGVMSFHRGSKLVSIWKAWVFLLFYRADIVHFHTSAFKNFLYTGFLFWIASLTRTRQITIHSGSFIEETSRYNFFRRFLFLRLLKRFHKLIVVNDDQREYLKAMLRKCPDITVSPAFIPPEINPLSIRQEMKQQFEHLRWKYKELLITSGYMESYYGHHLVMKAASRLHDTAVIHCFYTRYDTEYKKQLEELRKTCDHVYFFYDLSPDEFSYFLKNCEMYIRATDRDGDAVAIREALFYGKKVMASNCVSRPEGVELFALDNESDLFLKLRQSMGMNQKSVAGG